MFVNDLIDEGREEELLKLASSGKTLSFENKRLTQSNFCLEAFKPTSVYIRNTHDSLIDLDESYGGFSNYNHPIQSITDLSFDMIHEGDFDKLYSMLEYATKLQTINIYIDRAASDNPSYDLSSLHENVTKYNQYMNLNIKPLKTKILHNNVITKEASLEESQVVQFMVVDYHQNKFEKVTKLNNNFIILITLLILINFKL